jgi:PIN domain nuclease of toxin-antitoxin system
LRQLLDAHTLLWYVVDDPQLSQSAKAVMLDAANEILISPASYWEIAIKVRLGKLTLHQPYEAFLDLCLDTYGFTILPIEPRHTAALITLPLHHKDPFDRLLVAQAMVEDIPLISGDPVLDSYPIRRLW